MAKKYLITGGAGFIGINYVDRLLNRGESVVVFDNLSRSGNELNLNWLYSKYGENSFELIKGDVRNIESVRKACADVDIIVHLAAQVAVTTSVVNPREDFDINALGTFNVLEAARLSERKPIILYASTNKVYGGMEEVVVNENDDRYHYQDYENGIPETFPLDFHSPYGCSKGAGDQYVRDYHRIYDLPTVVFRQSCIYGKRQFGVEDQGWLAWFIIAALSGRPITIYGNGKQVRDVLFVDDLLDAYDSAVDRIDSVAGEVFNIGGGSSNTISIWKEFGPILERLEEKHIVVSSSNWRPGDQKIYVSDIRKAQMLLEWTPKTDVVSGIEILHKWVKENIKEPVTI